jgi:UDP-GlcNAc:undecaprenyl-phosphate GlcNAc-1-phosphate transferase
MFELLLLLSALVSFFITRLSIKLSLRRGILDLPGPRSSHSEPVPRLGGVGIVCGVYLPLMGLWGLGFKTLGQQGLWSREVMIILVVAAGMGVTGFCDDMFRLSPPAKLALQLVWVLVGVGFGIRLQSIRTPFDGALVLGALAVPVTVLWLAGFANVYNFMDGINGLAAGTGITYSAFYFTFCWRQGDRGLAALCVVLAGSCLGFLVHNFPRAGTFMGDTGSLFLGTFFALLVVRSAQTSASSPPLPALILVCSVFLFDAGFTLLRRLKRRENIFQPHRTHLYQRLSQVGVTHVRITGLYSLLHVLMGLLALVYVQASGAFRAAILGLTLSVLALFAASVSRLERRAGKRDVTGKAE